jgi:hypothetical protein
VDISSEAVYVAYPSNLKLLIKKCTIYDKIVLSNEHAEIKFNNTSFDKAWCLHSGFKCFTLDTDVLKPKSGTLFSFRESVIGLFEDEYIPRILPSGTNFIIP